MIRRQRTDDRRQRTEDRGQRSEVRGQRSEVRGQKTDDRGRKTEDRRQHAALRQAQDRRAASSVQKTISAPKSPVGASFACDLNGFNGFNEFNDFPCALRLEPCALCLVPSRSTPYERPIPVDSKRTPKRSMAAEPLTPSLPLSCHFVSSSGKFPVSLPSGIIFADSQSHRSHTLWSQS